MGSVLVNQIQTIRALCNKISSPNLSDQTQQWNVRNGGLRIECRRLKVDFRRLCSAWLVLFFGFKIVGETPARVNLSGLGWGAP